MALTEKRLIGADTTHASVYSIRRLAYYWNVTGLKGKIKQVKVEVKLRCAVNINKLSRFHLCLLNSWSPGNGWSNYNDATKYQPNSSTGSYITNKTHLNFGNHLVDSAFELTLTGGAGNVSKNITVNIPEANQDASLWNNSIKLIFYDDTGQYSPDLMWGTSSVNAITFYSQESQPIKYYNGSGWVDVVPYYYNGSSWVECSANYYDGSAWRSCST